MFFILFFYLYYLFFVCNMSFYYEVGCLGVDFIYYEFLLNTLNDYSFFYKGFIGNDLEVAPIIAIG